MSGFIVSQLFITPACPTTSFSDQTIIVTGSNIGLGFEAARHFARLEAAKVILAVRNLKAGEDAKAEIENSTSRPGVCEVWELDLASYNSVKAFAKRADDLPRLDIVVENAALGTKIHSIVEQDEKTITVNVVSTFLLAFLLLPKLKSTAKQIDRPTKLTIVTSEVHAWISPSDWQVPNTFEALRDSKKMSDRYPQSKFLGVCAVREMAPLLKDSGVVINMVNPGLCESAFNRENDKLFAFVKFLLARTTEVGGRTLVAGAAAGPESHGLYMTNGKIADEMVSSFLRTEDGEKVQKKIYGELKDKLEGIVSGVTQVS